MTKKTMAELTQERQRLVYRMNEQKLSSHRVYQHIMATNPALMLVAGIGSFVIGAFIAKKQKFSFSSVYRKIRALYYLLSPHMGKFLNTYSLLKLLSKPKQATSRLQSPHH